jgi:hypothetical protein
LSGFMLIVLTESNSDGAPSRALQETKRRNEISRAEAAEAGAAEDHGRVDHQSDRADLRPR